MTPHLNTFVLSPILAQEGDVLGAPSAPAGTAGAPPGAGTATGPHRAAGGPPAGTAPAPGLGPIFWILPVLLVFMIVSSIMSGRKQKKQREQLLSSAKKSDKVQTVGGVIGTIVELRQDTMVLRVHDADHTRVTFARSALQQVIKSGRGGGADDEADYIEDEHIEEEELAAR
ncbi:MAG: preprotein translocase subunit YajC [Planctomycetota bacterium]